MVDMPSQVVYESNLDYAVSYEELAKNKLVIADVTQKGILQFWFKSNKTLFQVFPSGKIQVKWNNPEEKKTLFQLVKNLLVAKNNEKLKITPTKQQVWISYPVPGSFKLYWCDEETEYSKKVQRPLSKQEREIRERHAEVYAEVDTLAEIYPSFLDLKMFTDELKKHRKEMGLEP